MDESVVKHLEQPKVGTLKLSEAIRIGARIRPQCRAIFWDAGRSCAIGAAVEAVGFARYGDIMRATKLHARFPALDAVGSEIYKRNDEGQTREQIADWLESIGY